MANRAPPLPESDCGKENRCLELANSKHGGKPGDSSWVLLDYMSSS
ncbi:hypothetical protein CCACVL1_20041 [Corchorus capsularis]|uniref:Uncharacterized protein n=1 Tax=Corchorus capsularis TaxID=210143 RepID=A0A1R3HD27_COCAP|nr:hypothetical protein CCACVL1_20041 [Corchorus capsularis]